MCVFFLISVFASSLYSPSPISQPAQSHRRRCVVFPISSLCWVPCENLGVYKGSKIGIFCCEYLTQSLTPNGVSWQNQPHKYSHHASRHTVHRGRFFHSTPQKRRHIHTMVHQTG